MMELLQNAYTFKVTFENVVTIDNMQNLTYDSRTKTSGFYYVLGVLSGIVNACKCWVIAICSATVSSPVNNFLTGSSQWIYQVPTAILSHPTVEGEDIFAAFDGNKLVELLIDDMGGFGRALEILHAVLLNARKPLEFVPVLTDVLVLLRSRYPRIKEQVDGMRKAFLVVIARRRVNEYSRFGELILDQVISSGLVRLDLEEYYLTCPYVLYLLLDFNAHPSSGNLWDFQNQEEMMKPWQSWEIFNGKVRELKAMAWVENGTVRWDKIHGGARFGLICDRDVLEQPLTYTLSKTQMATRSSGFNQAEDPSSTAFTCVKDVNRGFFHEVHQCKAVEGKLSLQTLKEEKDKATSPNDLFVLYCTGEVDGKVSWFKNCVVVDRTCWERYYGPFAARALFVSTVPPPKLVSGAVSATPQLTEKKRPISSCEEDHEEKEMTMETLKKLRLNADEV